MRRAFWGNQDERINGSDKERIYGKICNDKWVKRVRFTILDCPRVTRTSGSCHQFSSWMECGEGINDGLIRFNDEQRPTLSCERSNRGWMRDGKLNSILLYLDKLWLCPPCRQHGVRMPTGYSLWWLTRRLRASFRNIFPAPEPPTAPPTAPPRDNTPRLGVTKTRDISSVISRLILQIPSSTQREHYKKDPPITHRHHHRRNHAQGNFVHFTPANIT